MKHIKIKIIFAIILAVSFTSLFAGPQNWRVKTKVDMGEFVKEIMVINVSEKQMHSAMWLPFEFNVQAASASGKSRAQVEKDLEFFKSFLIFMVQSSTQRSDGSIKYATESEMKSRAILQCKDGSIVKPLNTIPPQLSASLEKLKSVMAGAAKNQSDMHILVFPFKNAKGKNIIEPSKRDKLVLSLRSNGIFDRSNFVWRTPFEAVFEGGYCPACSEKIKAKWYHCPWCGKKL